MKTNKENYIILIAILIVTFAFGYYVINSLILGLIFAIIAVALTYYILLKKDENKIKYQNINKIYNFVNMLNVEMLSCENVYQAYLSIENYVDVDFANILADDFHQQLLDLSDELNINAFKMYVRTIIMYDDQGGDFSRMQEIPTSLCQKNKLYYANLKTKKIVKLADISSLYALFALVAIFIKSALNEYYLIMTGDIKYQLIIFTILLLWLLTYALTFIEFFKNKIKGL